MKKKRPTNGLVFAFPTRSLQIEGIHIFFLFSVRQVVEVLNHINVQSVPFAPQHAEGVAQWRGRVLPVLALEHYLGIRIARVQMPMRPIVIRGILEDRTGKFSEHYTVFKVGTGIRQLELPLICEPVKAPVWVKSASYLSGTYQLEDRLYFVMNMEAILNSNIKQDHYVS